MQTTPLSRTERLPFVKTRKPGQDPRDVAAACVQLLFCTLFWGAFYVLGKLAVGEAPPLVVASLRFLVAGSVLLVLVFLREKGLPRLRGNDAWLVLALGFLGVFGFNALTLQGFLYAPASDAALINPTLSPVITTLLAALLFREKIWRAKLYGMALTVLGLVILFASHPPAASSGMRWLGEVCFVSGALAWSGYTLLTRFAIKRFSSLALTTYTALAGLVFLLPLSARELVRVPWGALSGRFWLAIGIMGVLSTVVAFLLWNGAIRRGGASRATSFMPLVPIFGLVLGALVLQEAFTPVYVLVAALAVAGVYQANKPKRMSIRVKTIRTIKRVRIKALRGINQAIKAKATPSKVPVRFTNQLRKPERLHTGFLG